MKKKFILCEDSLNSEILDILEEFGMTIDPHGCADGDYNRALRKIKSIFKKYKTYATGTTQEK